jgi:hypothetical protein
VGLASAVPTATSVGRLRFEVVRGVDEEAESPVVPDMTTSDTVIGVVVLENDDANTQSAQLGGSFQPNGASASNSVLKVRHRNIGDFVAGTGVMTSTANKEDNTGNVYLVCWSDVAYAATDYAAEALYA